MQALSAAGSLGRPPVPALLSRAPAARLVSPRRRTSAGKLSGLGKEVPSRKPAVIPAALASPTAGSSAVLVPTTYDPQAGYDPQEEASSSTSMPPANLQGYQNNVTLLEKQFKKSTVQHPTQEEEAATAAAAAAALAAAAAAAPSDAAAAAAEADYDLDGMLDLLSDMENLAADLDLAMESTSELSDFTVGALEGCSVSVVVAAEAVAVAWAWVWLDKSGVRQECRVLTGCLQCTSASALEGTSASARACMHLLPSAQLGAAASPCC